MKNISLNLNRKNWEKVKDRLVKIEKEKQELSSKWLFDIRESVYNKINTFEVLFETVFDNTINRFNSGYNLIRFNDDYKTCEIKQINNTTDKIYYTFIIWLIENFCLNLNSKINTYLQPILLFYKNKLSKKEIDIEQNKIVIKNLTVLKKLINKYILKEEEFKIDCAFSPRLRKLNDYDYDFNLLLSDDNRNLKSVYSIVEISLVLYSMYKFCHRYDNDLGRRIVTTSFTMDEERNKRNALSEGVIYTLKISAINKLLSLMK